MKTTDTKNYTFQRLRIVYNLSRNCEYFHHFTFVGRAPISTTKALSEIICYRSVMLHHSFDVPLFPLIYFGFVCNACRRILSFPAHKLARVWSGGILFASWSHLSTWKTLRRLATWEVPVTQEQGSHLARTPTVLHQLLYQLLVEMACLKQKLKIMWI